MATNGTQSQRSIVNAVVHAALGKETSSRRQEPSSASGSPESALPRPSGYGLPCSKCHLYYPADLNVCPTCKHNERVSPAAPKIASRVAQAAADIPDTSLVDRSAKTSLRQFKSQLQEAHAEVTNAAESVCKFEEHHSGEPTRAEICAACMNSLQGARRCFRSGASPGIKRGGPDQL